MKKTLSILLAILLIFSVSPKTIAADLYNTPSAHPWTLTTVDGQTIRHDSFPGKTVLLMFYWGSECSITGGNIKTVCEHALAVDDNVVIIAVSAAQHGTGKDYYADSLEKVLNVKEKYASHCDRILFTYDSDESGRKLMWDFVPSVNGVKRLEAGTFNLILTKNGQVHRAWQNQVEDLPKYFAELDIIAIVNITATAAPGGTATGSGTYESGQTATLVATPNPDYIFDGWYADGYRISPNPSYTISVTADQQLEARFTPTTVPNIAAASGWAQESIQLAHQKGFIPTDLLSNYQHNITRQQFCRMAVKWTEYKTGKSIEKVMEERGAFYDPDAFIDTDDRDILAAFALGITSGTGNKHFSPNGQITREQAATMLRNTCNIIQMDISNITPHGFVDMDKASPWAVDGINFAGNAGLMRGVGGNRFAPADTFTIEQSIMTLNNVSWLGKADLVILANEVFRLTNIEREKAGLPPFEQTAALTKTAEVRADELKTLYSHDRPDGRSCFTAYTENGVTYRTAGENIAYGQSTAARVVEAWMNSPGHKANILNPAFGHLGVGATADSNGTLAWSQNFTD